MGGDEDKAYGYGERMGDSLGRDGKNGDGRESFPIQLARNGTSSLDV